MANPSRMHVAGPMEPFAAGFFEELVRRRYSPGSLSPYLAVMRHLSRWLGDHGLSLADLTPQRLQDFAADRRAQGFRYHSARGTIGVLAAYLRTVGAIPIVQSPAIDTAMERILQAFAEFTINERGLTQASADRSRSVARLFLSFCCSEGGTGNGNLGDITPEQVTAFILAESRHRRAGQFRMVVGVLRSLLRFLYLSGHTSRSLASAIPAVPGWRDTSVSRALDGRDLARMVASCDRQTAIGLRDFGILTTLARLGLRSCELVSLTLDDVDWRAGEIIVRGKGGHAGRLPLPTDVGEALAAYCQRGRPSGDCRVLFIRIRAPYGPITRAMVRHVVASACRRAGLPVVNPHRLRHSAATAMRQAGAPLAEISQVLRHRRAASTAIYAKDDRVALATVARRWPGGAA